MDQQTSELQTVRGIFYIGVPQDNPILTADQATQERYVYAAMWAQNIRSWSDRPFRVPVIISAMEDLPPYRPLWTNTPEPMEIAPAAPTA